jgi:WD40 repeat protein
VDAIPLRTNFTLSDDGTILVAWERAESTSTELDVMVYHLGGDEAVSTPLQATFPSNLTTTFAISPDSNYIIATQRSSSASLSQFTVYDAETGAQLTQWSVDRFYYTYASTFSPDMRYLVTIGTTFDRVGFLEVWEFETLLTASIPSPIASVLLNTSEVLDVRFSPDQAQLMVLTDDPSFGDGAVSHFYHVSLYYWEMVEFAGIDVPSAELSPIVIERGDNPVLVPNSPLLITTWFNFSWQGGRNLVLSEYEGGAELLELEGYSNGIVSPDGSLLVALSREGQMVAWEIDSLLQRDQSPMFTLDSSGVRGIAFSTNGDRIYQQTTYSVVTLAVVSD